MRASLVEDLVELGVEDLLYRRQATVSKKWKSPKRSSSATAITTTTSPHQPSRRSPKPSLGVCHADYIVGRLQLYLTVLLASEVIVLEDLLLRVSS